jgi:predicted dehydrogenase
VMLDFGGSTFAVVDGTFNVVASKSPRMEIYGLEGTLLVNDTEGGAPPLELYHLDDEPGAAGWTTPPADGGADNPGRFEALQRGVLLEHLADCLRDGTPPVLSAQHARHVLEIMIAGDRSAREGAAVELETTFRQGPS